MRKLLFLLSLLLFVSLLRAQNIDSIAKLKSSEGYPRAYIIKLSTESKPVLPKNYQDLQRYNFYGICWNGKADDNLLYAKHMGCHYVFYQYGMENSALASDLFFYLETPDQMVCKYLGVDSYINLNKTYIPEQIKTYERYFALKDTTSKFPLNIATGWPTRNAFAVEPDMQQQKVIDYFVDKTLLLAHSKENVIKKFLFAGIAWDVPNLTGDFHDGNQCTLAKWTGKDSSAHYSDAPQQYRTYSEGRAAYFIKLTNEAYRAFPGRKLNFIYEPYPIYEWVKECEKLDFGVQAKLFENAFISQESGKTSWTSWTEFVDDARIFKSGLITKQHVGSTTPDNHDFPNNLAIASKAAINGAWFNWYGRISGSGDNALLKNIYEVPHWLQLIRVVANWDNLNGVPLSKRNLTGSVYTSTNSRMDENIIYSRQPETQKLYVVFINNKGVVRLNPGEKVVSVHRVDSYFMESDNGSNEVLIEGNSVKPKYHK